MQDAVTVPRAPAVALTPRLTLALALAAGFAAANVWFNQPMLGVIASSLGARAEQVAALPTATQIGFAAGILLLVPLGDAVSRRTLILAQLAGLTLAALAAALAPGVATLTLASAGVGMAASVAQQIVPFAAELAAPSVRARAVGTVMSGLLGGILLGRVFSGALAEHFGWRATFGVAAGLGVGVALVLAALLPHSRPATRLSYGALLFSVADLFGRLPALRRASVVQAGLFGAMSAFWSVLVWRLQAPPLRLGSDVAGLFGVLGAAGVMAASLAGRIADRVGPLGVIGAGCLLAAAGYAVFALWPGLGGLILGLVLLDLGVQAAIVGNQAVIYALAPEARGRVNTAFMTVMFAGGAIGSAAAGYGWVLAGWPAVCGVGLALTGLALAVHLSAGRGKRR
jgi:predicted MFS family arabinose efflux permease